MRQSTLNIIVIFSVLIGLWSFSSCSKEETAEGIDKELYDMAQNTSGFTWYKNSSSYLDKSIGSGHNFPFLRTRYNSTAADQLDSIGKIKTDASFAEGSFIVKELYNDDKSLSRYAMLYKQSNDVNADTSGWIWGYVNADGSVAVTAADKGKQCIGCHIQADNIDYMLMNKFFP